MRQLDRYGWEIGFKKMNGPVKAHTWGEGGLEQTPGHVHTSGR